MRLTHVCMYANKAIIPCCEFTCCGIIANSVTADKSRIVDADIFCSLDVTCKPREPMILRQMPVTNGLSDNYWLCKNGAYRLNWGLFLFTAHRNARIESAVLAIAIPSVCPPVCLSVIRRYCVKTTARSTVQFAVWDSKMCLVFQKLKIFRRDDPVPLKSWLKLTHPLQKAVSFETFCIVARQR